MAALMAPILSSASARCMDWCSSRVRVSSCSAGGRASTGPAVGQELVERHGLPCLSHVLQVQPGKAGGDALGHAGGHALGCDQELVGRGVSWRAGWHGGRCIGK